MNKIKNREHNSYCIFSNYILFLSPNCYSENCWHQYKSWALKVSGQCCISYRNQSFDMHSKSRNWYVLITTLLETELLLYFCAKFHVYRTFLTDIWEELMLCQNLTSKSPSKAWLTLFKMVSFGVTYRCRKGLKVPST